MTAMAEADLPLFESRKGVLKTMMNKRVWTPPGLGILASARMLRHTGGWVCRRLRIWTQMRPGWGSSAGSHQCVFVCVLSPNRVFLFKFSQLRFFYTFPILLFISLYCIVSPWIPFTQVILCVLCSQVVYFFIRLGTFRLSM